MTRTRSQAKKLDAKDSIGKMNEDGVKTINDISSYPMKPTLKRRSENLQDKEEAESSHDSSYNNDDSREYSDQEGTDEEGESKSEDLSTNKNETVNESFQSNNLSNNDVSRSSVEGDSFNDKEEQANVNSNHSIWLPVVIIIILAVACAMMVERSTDSPPDEKMTPADLFLTNFNLYKSEVIKQHKKLWRIAGSIMKSHIADDDPIQPAVMMLVSTRRASKTRELLARKFAKAYSVRCDENDPVLIEGSTYKSMGYSQAKEKLDTEISHSLSRGSCAAVISNFQDLPPASTTVFYQFCENDQAPFKNVAVIFTLEVSHGSWDSGNQYSVLQDDQAIPHDKLWDGIVDTYLYHSLGSRDNTGIMTRDMISGLLTRITPSIMWVTEENVDRLKLDL